MSTHSLRKVCAVQDNGTQIASADLDPKWTVGTLYDLGLPRNAEHYDPAEVAAFALEYLQIRVSVEPDDPLGLNATAFYEVARAALKHPGARIQLSS